MPRYRRRRSSKSISKTMKNYMLGILFVALASVIVSIATYVSTVIPAENLTFGSVSISNTIFINFIGWALGIVLLLTAIRKFGIRL
jgi:small basic protein